MTAAHRAPEWPQPNPAGADRGDPDRVLDGWRFWERIRSADRRYSTYVDLVLATAIFAVSSWWVFHDDLPKTELLFSAALAFPLVLRRRSPVPVFAVIAAVAFTQWLVTEPLPSDAALLVAVCTVAAISPWARVLVCAAVLETGIVMATVRWDPTGSDLESLVYLTGLAFTALLAGVVIRAVRSQFHLLAERAERLERERDQQASLAAAAERARIAAGDARRRLAQHPGDGDPGRWRRRRDEVRPVAGRRCHVRGVRHRPRGPDRHASDARRVRARTPQQGERLRASQTARQGTWPRPTPEHGRAGGANGSSARSSIQTEADGASAPYAPQPGLAELEALVDRVRATGLRVKLEAGRPGLRALRGRRADRLPAGARGAHQRPQARGIAGIGRGSTRVRRSRRHGAGV